MALSPEQKARLALVNDLITTDPQAAAGLADRFAELATQVEAARRSACLRAISPREAEPGSPFQGKPPAGNARQGGPEAGV
jgi:hypothetical protein